MSEEPIEPPEDTSPVNPDPIDVVDGIVTRVEVTVTTVRNNVSHIESEILSQSKITPSPHRMYNAAYAGRYLADDIMSGLGTPLKETIARQFGEACESGHEDIST